MVLPKYSSFDSFIDDVAFDLWSKNHIGVLKISNKIYRSAAGIDGVFNWVYGGESGKKYSDGFFCSHEDGRDGNELRNCDGELKMADQELVKRGVASLIKGRNLDLKVADGFPTGLAADILQIAESKLVSYGKLLSASRLFEQGRRYGRSEHQIYEKIHAYFSK